MSDEGEEMPDWKVKKLEVLARAREVARQNRLKATAEKKVLHKKEVEERKVQRKVVKKTEEPPAEPPVFQEQPTSGEKPVSQEVISPARTSRAADYKPQKMKAQDFSRFFTMR